VLLIIEGYPTGAPILKRALDAFLSGAISRDEEVRWLAMSARVATNLWDDERRYVLSARDVELTRRSGALTDLPTTLSAQVGVRFHAGEIAAAAALIDEIEATTEATGIRLAPYGALAQAAWRGREDEVMALIDPSMSEIMARGEGAGLTLIDWAKALLYNGLGRYEEAAAAAELATERRTALLWFNWALPELIEAAARSGRPGLAAGGLEQLAEMTQACGTDWALGIEARSRALLAEGEAAESFHREAIERLGRTRIRVELARAHLLYGEWLRRQRRRLDARQQLHVAHEMLTASSIEAFAARAARELLATGETARKRTVETSTQLTARETQIARLARAGLSNPEIGARLFLSPRTVEYHLHKIFAKLDISSRHQLQEALDGDADAARPASLEPRA
jgi:DNA-binding CsgD family transcriptional regulator